MTAMKPPIRSDWWSADEAEEWVSEQAAAYARRVRDHNEREMRRVGLVMPKALAATYHDALIEGARRARVALGIEPEHVDEREDWEAEWYARVPLTVIDEDGYVIS